METQLDPNELIEIMGDNTRPDRLPSALLIIGFILASLFGSVGITSLLAAGRIHASILLITILGFLGMFLGWKRKVRGSSSTKQLYETTRQKIQSGAVAGVAAALIVYMVTQSKDLNLSWVVPFLILSILWALIFGIPCGGLGGLVLASIWKNKYAAYFGGAITTAIFSYLWMFNYFGG